MLHQPTAPVADDPAYPSKRRLGVWMFLIYSLLYAGFVAVNLLAPRLMEARILAGVNFATVYGLGLILLAIALALLYNLLCLRHEHKAGGLR